MKSNVALIGFMGVGKSAVGRILADDLGKSFVDSDYLIAQRTGKTIARIFQEEGEIAFRELEIGIIKELAAGANQLIACGGGVVLNKINLDRLKLDGVIVWLTATPEVILKRALADGTGRPLMPPKLAEIRRLLSLRKPYYERAADFAVDTSDLDIEAIVKRIRNELRTNADFN